MNPEYIKVINELEKINKEKIGWRFFTRTQLERRLSLSFFASGEIIKELLDAGVIEKTDSLYAHYRVIGDDE